MSRTYLPDHVMLDSQLAAPDFRAAIERLLTCAGAARMAAVERWAVPVDSSPRTGDLLANLPADPARPSVELTLADGSLAALSPHEGIWRVDVALKVDKSRLESVPEQVARAHAFCRAMLADDALRAGQVRWQGNGADFLPKVPLAGDRTWVVLVTSDEVQTAYDRPDDFFAAWEEREERAGRVLLARALGARDNLEFARAVVEGQWRMARAAAAGRTEYEPPMIRAGEDEVYRSGEPVLEPVGYLPGEALAEYAAVVESDRHVNGWEIFERTEQLQAGALQDGRPLKAVRVVFPERRMADAEKRPLLDNGIHVLVDTGSGEVEEVTE